MPTILLDKNQNSKIGCEYMVHIMKPRTKKLDFVQVVTFKAPDAEADYQLVDYAEDEAKKIPLHLIRLAEGSEEDDFLQRVYEKHGIHAEDKVGIYFFKRLPRPVVQPTDKDRNIQPSS